VWLYTQNNWVLSFGVILSFMAWPRHNGNIEINDATVSLLEFREAKAGLTPNILELLIRRIVNILNALIKKLLLTCGQI
jgi:hypothetical protein